MNLNNNLNEVDFDLIERFVTQNMSLEEEVSFKEKLKNNPELQIQVDAVKTMIFGIEKQALKETLDSFHKTLPEVHEDIHPKHSHYSNVRKLAAIAAVVAFTWGGYWFFSKEDTRSLYSKYYEPDPGLPTTMSTTADFVFYDAMVNYKRKDYSLALSKWEPLLKIKVENDTLNYFIASAYLANGAENDAIPYFQKVIAEKESNFKNDAYYYLGLAYLKAENVELAKQNLNLTTFKNSKEILSDLSN